MSSLASPHPMSPTTVTAAAAAAAAAAAHHKPSPAHILHPPTPPHSSPSSPSSTHSSSSAIFERDIEPLSLSTLSAPRDHTLAALVPSVLDEAIEALTAGDAGEDVEVEVASGQGPGAAEDSEGFRRSPSPPGIPASSSLAAARPPLQERQSTTPFIPGGFAPPSSVPPTGLTTPPSPGSPRAQLDTLLLPVPVPTSPQPPARTAAHSSKRLSFISYSDLLLSSPVTSLPLSQVTSPQQVPPHLSYLGSAPPPVGGGRSRDQSAYGDEGGEWERERLGRGLDERLEEVLKGREVGKA